MFVPCNHHYTSCNVGIRKDGTSKNCHFFLDLLAWALLVTSASLLLFMCHEGSSIISWLKQLWSKNTVCEYQERIALLEPEQVLTFEVPIVFQMTTFSSQMIAFFTEHTLKLTKFGMYVTPAEKFHNLLSSLISTTRCRYNQGKCGLAHNSQIFCCTFKNIISTRSLNCAESRHVGHVLQQPCKNEE